MRQPVFLGGGEGGGSAAPGGRVEGDPGLRDEGSRSGRPEPGPPVGRPGAGTLGPLPRDPIARGGRSAAPTFYVAGFWRRVAAGIIDLAVLAPVMLLLTWLAAVVTGIHLPPANHRGLDFWLDMILAREPALVGGIGLAMAIAIIYLFLFQATTGRTPGMRVLRVEVIDLFGESPSILRTAARTAGYLASAATLGLGFLWVGFDSEKRALHDWLAGTYVVRTDGAGRSRA
ncbi:MAG TPA: RDD family protein [Kofleriaceae bacterium]|nr:RDD family protein [Kofleriaceae bacterium]